MDNAKISAGAVPASADNPSPAGTAELTKERITEVGLKLRIQAFENANYRFVQGSKMTESEQDEFNQQVEFARAIWSLAAPVVQSTPDAAKGIDPTEKIKVDGFDYPTTYGDLARIRPETLWNRYVCGPPWPNAKTAFLVARAIPFVKQEVISAPAAQAKPEPAAQVLNQALQFADDVISNAFDGFDLDGATIQEMAEARGLIKPKTMAEPCGPVCNCMENGVEFPAACYQKTYISALRTASKDQQSALGEKGGES